MLVVMALFPSMMDVSIHHEIIMYVCQTTEITVFFNITFMRKKATLRKNLIIHNSVKYCVFTGDCGRLMIVESCPLKLFNYRV